MPGRTIRVHTVVEPTATVKIMTIPDVGGCFVHEWIEDNFRREFSEQLESKDDSSVLSTSNVDMLHLGYSTDMMPHSFEDASETFVQILTKSESIKDGNDVLLIAFSSGAPLAIELLRQLQNVELDINLHLLFIDTENPKYLRAYFFLQQQKVVFELFKGLMRFMRINERIRSECGRVINDAENFSDMIEKLEKYIETLTARVPSDKLVRLKRTVYHLQSFYLYEKELTSEEKSRTTLFTCPSTVSECGEDGSLGWGAVETRLFPEVAEHLSFLGGLHNTVAATLTVIEELLTKTSEEEKIEAPVSAVAGSSRRITFFTKVDHKLSAGEEDSVDAAAATSSLT